MYRALFTLAQTIGEGELNIPKGNADHNTISTSLNIIFAIAAAVAALLVAINALRIIISRGNPQDMAKARDGVIYAAVGLVIILAAFIIVRFVLENL